MSNAVYKALADSTRRRILELLKSKEMTAGEIAEHFDVSKPALSRQFQILLQADLVYSRKQGNQVIYGLNSSVLQTVLLSFVDFFSEENK